MAFGGDIGVSMPVSGVWAPPPASPEPRTARGTRRSAAAASMRPSTQPSSGCTGRTIASPRSIERAPVLALSQIRAGMYSLQPNQSQIRLLHHFGIALPSRLVRAAGRARKAASGRARRRVGHFSPIRTRRIRPRIESSASAKDLTSRSRSQSARTGLNERRRDRVH